MTNFLKALTAIIEIADERLFDVERIKDVPAHDSLAATMADLRMDQPDDLLLLALSLARMARDQIDTLSNERPNDPATVKANEKQRELLVIFAEGFERIATALSDLARNPNESLLMSRARGVVESVGVQVNQWWKTNATEAIDWSIRLPIFIASVAALGLAGAYMPVATTAVAALIGGSKVIRAIKDSKKSD